MNGDELTNTPKYFNLLDQKDKEEYRKLQTILLQATEKRHRGHRLDIFLDCLDKIHRFSQRGEDDDWKRCCVCGVCFLECGIALNSHQMKFLTNKCKSSINGALKMMKYKTTSARGDINPELVDFLPILKGNTNELRQWSVRTPENYKPPLINRSLPQQDTMHNELTKEMKMHHINSASGSEVEEVTESLGISNFGRSFFTVSIDNNNDEKRQSFTINTKINSIEEQQTNPTFKSGSVIITDGDVQIVGSENYNNIMSNAASDNNLNSLFSDIIRNDFTRKALSLDDFDIVPSQCYNEINDSSELIGVSCLTATKTKEFMGEYPFLEI